MLTKDLIIDTRGCVSSVRHAEWWFYSHIVARLIGSASFEEGGNEGVAFVLDLSEQKRAEEALQKAQAHLAHFARVTTLGELSASITHEMNQPLAGVLTNANASLHWLDEDSPNLTEARDAIRRIVRDGNRASDVIKRMRALFKKTPPPKETVDINEIIQEVLAVTHNELQRNQVSLRTGFAKDLPMVIGDKTQLQQVILNLVINAIEAMHGVSEASRELWISSEKNVVVLDEPGGNSAAGNVHTKPQSSFVLVAVQDSGPGIDSTQLQRVFEAYYTTKSQGMGMGLAISRSIIEAHGGRLRAKSNTASGALFEFTLPVADQAGTR
jgi:signal transduction histidine kinase